nr:10110_t:CDS:2 [Entrophospora candida]
MSSKSFEKPLSEIGKIFKKLKRMSYHHNSHPQEDKTKEKKQKKSHKKATKRASMPILSSSKQQQNHFLNQKQKSNSLKVRNTKIETRNSLDMIDKNISTSSSNNSYVNINNNVIGLYENKLRKMSNNNNNNNTILIEKKHDNNKILYDDCENCSNNFNSWNWCQPCNSKRFEKSFSKWTSNSFIIDKFIQKTQLSSKGHFNKLEWIPFERFKDINLINNESFSSTIYEAIWIDGDILNWNHEKGEWMRFGQKKVVLKTLEKITIDEGFFDEIEKCLARLEFDECTNLNLYFGFTQNPKTKIYMIVMDYAPDGNLHQFIKSSSYYKNISWFDKISLLYNISFGLKELHDINIIHGNLHPGNILQHYMVPKISDYGLFKNVSRQILNNFLETYHGFIQNVDEIKDDAYIAPEILSGKQQKLTISSDIYSFGIIMSEILFGRPPYYNRSFDKDLIYSILIKGGGGKSGRTPKSLLDLMKRCWDKNPDNRPSAFDLCREFSKFEWWTIDQRIKKYNHDDGDEEQQKLYFKNDNIILYYYRIIN